MSNVGQMQNSALMHSSSRLSASLSSHAERGGESVLGCAPFGLQRAVAAPRSNAASVGRRASAAGFAREAFQGKVGLLVKLGAASPFFLSPSRKPNPAFERTAHGKPWSTAQGERWASKQVTARLHHWVSSLPPRLAGRGRSVYE